MFKEFLLQAKEEEIPVYGQCFENETITDFEGKKLEFESVVFKKCRFIHCCFEGAFFRDILIEGCEFTNCNFSKSYFKKVSIKDSKADGSRFPEAVLKEMELVNSSFCYCDFTLTCWEDGRIRFCNLSETSVSETKFKRTSLENTNLTRTDFFKTPLKSMNLSDCTIDGMIFSDNFYELKGVKLNMFQAAEIARMLGIQIV